MTDIIYKHNYYFEEYDGMYHAKPVSRCETFYLAREYQELAELKASRASCDEEAVEKRMDKIERELKMRIKKLNEEVAK